MRVFILQNHILELLNKVYKHLTFVPKDGESRLDVYNRDQILSWACKFGHSECIDNAKAQFNKFQTVSYK